MTTQGDPLARLKSYRRMLIGMLVVIVFLIAVTVTSICYLATGPDPSPNQAATPAPHQSVPAVTPIVAGPTPIVAARGIHGRVLAPDGSPASGATVLLVPSGPNGVRFRNGKVFYEQRGGPRVPRVSSDAQGQYALPDTNGVFTVVAITNDAFSERNQDDIARNPDLTLTKWGRIEGRLMFGQKPAAHVQLQAGAKIPPSESDRAVVSMISRAETDAQGKFTMEGVIPGTNLIDRSFSQAFGNGSMSYFATIASVEVAEGQTATVTIGADGRTAIGKFVFTNGLRASDYSINARAYSLDTQDSDLAYFLDVDRNRNFRIDGLLPGDYRIHINLDPIHSNRRQEPDQPRFTVPDDKGTDPIVIPDIQLN